MKNLAIQNSIFSENIPCSWIVKLNIVKISVLFKAIYRFNAISIKIPMAFSQRQKKILKFVWNYKGLSIAKAVLKSRTNKQINQLKNQQRTEQTFFHRRHIWLTGTQIIREMQTTVRYQFTDVRMSITKNTRDKFW